MKQLDNSFLSSFFFTLGSKAKVCRAVAGTCTQCGLYFCSFYIRPTTYRCDALFSFHLRPWLRLKKGKSKHLLIQWVFPKSMTPLKMIIVNLLGVKANVLKGTRNQGLQNVLHVQHGQLLFWFVEVLMLFRQQCWCLNFLSCLQAALKKSNLELEAELKVKLNNIEMLNEAAQMKDRIIKVLNGLILHLFCVGLAFIR